MGDCHLPAHPVLPVGLPDAVGLGCPETVPSGKAQHSWEVSVKRCGWQRGTPRRRPCAPLSSSALPLWALPPSTLGLLELSTCAYAPTFGSGFPVLILLFTRTFVIRCYPQPCT